jgi:predicted nuclease with TOPRIM domain
MNDTPRTDEAWKTIHTTYELAGEMKRMERELNEANDHIKRLENFLMLLEEAADEMEKEYAGKLGFDTYDELKIKDWRKAKEAKP